MVESTMDRVSGGSRLAATTSLAVAAPICLLVLLQGGYFGLATCACGLVVSVAAVIVWLRLPMRKRSIPLASLLFCGAAAAYLISAFANGASLTTLAETGAWASCAGFSLLCAAQSTDSRARTVRYVSWFGIVTAVMAVCVFVGIVQLEGGVTDGRLEFTFQYANATAIWFGACTFFCLLGPDANARSFAALPVAAMLLTQSAGAVLSFLVVAVALGLWLAKRGEWRQLLSSLVQGALGVMLFCVTVGLDSPVALVTLAATAGACFVIREFGDDFVNRIDAQKVTCMLVVLFLVALVASIVILRGRVQNATYSAAERLYHVKDGLALWSTSPLLGVGPDNWQYLFRYIQSAPYDVAVVHSSFVQMLDDAGVLGIVPLVVAGVLGVWALVNRCKKQDEWALAELAATGLLLFHSVIEFDLQFGALAFLLALLLCGPDGATIDKTGLGLPGSRATDKNPAPLAKGLITGIVATLCVPLCVMGLACATTSVVLQRANASGAYKTTINRFWSNPWAVIDPNAQSAYLLACYQLGDYEEVTAAYGRMAAPSDESTICAALAFSARGEQAQAATVLMEALEAKPYDEKLLAEAERFAQSVGIDPSVRARFDETVRRMRQRIDTSGLTVRLQQLG